VLIICCCAASGSRLKRGVAEEKASQFYRYLHNIICNDKYITCHNAPNLQNTPGAMVITRMPNGANSLARGKVIETTPPINRIGTCAHENKNKFLPLLAE